MESVAVQRQQMILPPAEFGWDDPLRTALLLLLKMSPPLYLIWLYPVACFFLKKFVVSAYFHDGVSSLHNSEDHIRRSDQSVFQTKYSRIQSLARQASDQSRRDWFHGIETHCISDLNSFFSVQVKEWICNTIIGMSCLGLTSWLHIFIDAFF